jgi:hypothetical protein
VGRAAASLWAATVGTPNRIFASGLLRRLLRLAAFLEVSIVAKIPPEAPLFVAGAAKANAALNILEAHHCQNLILFHLSIVVDVVLLLCKIDGEDVGVVSLLYEYVALNTWHSDDVASFAFFLSRHHDNIALCDIFSLCFLARLRLWHVDEQ